MLKPGTVQVQLEKLQLILQLKLLLSSSPKLSISSRKHHFFFAFSWDNNYDYSFCNKYWICFVFAKSPQIQVDPFSPIEEESQLFIFFVFGKCSCYLLQIYQWFQNKRLLQIIWEEHIWTFQIFIRIGTLLAGIADQIFLPLWELEYRFLEFFL